MSQIIYAPSGRALVINTGDGVLVLSASTAQVIHSLTGTPNSGVLAFFGESDTLIVGGADADITLWDTAAGRRVAVLPGTQGDNPSASAAPSGDMLMTSTRTAASFWNLSGLTSGTVLRGNAPLGGMDISKRFGETTVCKSLFEAIGPIRILGIP